MNSRNKEPQITARRFRGLPCATCGTHVRRISDGYCISCAQRPTESIRASKREWHQRNYEKSRALTKAWLSRNPGAVAKRNIQYDSSVKRQTPRWADLQKINEIYMEARQQGVTVDHIVPLHGKRVCGLHVETNLRLLPRRLNAQKGNRFDEQFLAHPNVA